MAIRNAKFTKGGVQNNNNNLQPGQKPVAYIDGFNVVIPTVDGGAVDNAVNVLANAGYSVTGKLDATTYLATKNGTSYAFTTTVGTAYFSLTVDGEKVEYIKSGEDSTTTWKQVKDAAKGGTGMLEGNTYATYASKTDASKVVTSAAAATVIKTGYAKVDFTSGTNDAITAVKSGNTVLTTGDSFAVADGLTVTYTGAVANAGATVGKNVTLTLTSTDDADKLVKTQVKTLSKDDVVAGGKELTFTVNTAKITKDITGMVAASADMPAAVTYTVPAKDTKNGLTFTWTLDQTAGFVGDTITGTLTVTGAASAAQNVALKIDSNKVTVWNTPDVVAGGATIDTNTLKFANGTSYMTGAQTFRFSFTAAAGTLAADYT